MAQEIVGESYPFFKIAKETNTPLSVVYKFLDDMERNGTLTQWAYMDIRRAEYSFLLTKIARAAIIERERRKDVRFPLQGGGH